MNGDLDRRIAESLARPVGTAVRRFAASLAETAGAQAVLFYGSNLRTGSLEGVLDFYVLLPGGTEPAIWPRVSYHEYEAEGTVLRAKVATMTLAKFAEAAGGGLNDTTIWARFVQPSALAWPRGEDDPKPVVAAIASAARTAARLAVALGPPQGTVEDYWAALFRATYSAEFRVEAAGRERSILAADPAHYAGLLPLALTAAGIGFDRNGETIAPRLDPAERARMLRWWRRRRLLGKPLNLLRLLRAATTFEGAARYAAWKLERHTGVPVEVTPWRERHPVLAAPGVLWSVWRARKRA